MGGTWRSEDFAGEAIFQLNCLTIDDDLLGPGRRPVARAAVGHIWGKKQLEHFSYFKCYLISLGMHEQVMGS